MHGDTLFRLSRTARNIGRNYCATNPCQSRRGADLAQITPELSPMPVGHLCTARSARPQRLRGVLGFAGGGSVLRREGECWFQASRRLWTGPARRCMVQGLSPLRPLFSLSPNGEVLITGKLKVALFCGVILWAGIAGCKETREGALTRVPARPGKEEPLFRFFFCNFRWRRV